MSREPRKISWLLLVFAIAPRASATYSIVASDTATRAVGGAGTSCLGGGDVYIIYGSVPGTGVIHAQATYSRPARDRGLELLAEGVAPAEVVAALIDPSFDPNAQSRQFAVADANGRLAAFTGTEDRPYAADRAGAIASFRYSVQGNILTSSAVLSQAAGAFEATACDLPERLMRALEAGADNGEGDSRCTTSRGIPSDSAFIQVDRAGEPAGSYLELHVRSSDETNPLPELRAQFDRWRAAHPCPTAGADSGAAAHPVETPGGCACRLAEPGGRKRSPWNPLWTLGALAALLTARRWNPRRYRC